MPGKGPRGGVYSFANQTLAEKVFLWQNRHLGIMRDRIFDVSGPPRSKFVAGRALHP